MRRTLILLALSKFIFFVTSLSAQTTWMAEQRGISIVIEFLKPNFVDSNSSFATSVLFFSSRFSLSQSITIVGDLPFAHHGYGDDFGLNRYKSSTIIGNPYLGVEIHKPAFPVFGELGFRLPLGTDRDEFYDASRATDIGNFTDPDRFEAFTLYDFSVMARLNYHRELGSDFQLLLRSGWTGGGSVDGEYGPSGFQTLDYSFQLGYQVEQVRIVGGLTGRYLLDGQTFHMQKYGGRGRTSHQLAVTASVDFAAVRPGLHFRIPLDDYLKDEIFFVLGLNLGIRLK